LFAFMVRVQLPMPLQEPDQPAKYAPLAATAVSFTLLPELKDAVQVDGQLMPAGVLVTVPVEVPANWTVSWKVVTGAEATGAEATGSCWADKLTREIEVATKTAIRTRRQVKDIDLRGYLGKGLIFDGRGKWPVVRGNQVVDDARVLAETTGMNQDASLQFLRGRLGFAIAGRASAPVAT